MSSNLAEQFERLPDYLGQHITLSVLALGLGIAISLPTAVGLAWWKPARGPVLTAAGVIQTIPSLALLALMVPLLGLFGFWPALVALVLYSMLPILRNTVTGLSEVDPALTEAARGLGMTRMQMLMRVELPLAAPVVIAGVRTATVWVVGIATLSTPVGQTSLGNYIFSGLQTRNWTAVLFGCVAAAALAIALDALIALLESAARLRSRPRTMFAAAGLAVIVLGGLAAPMVDLRSSVPAATVAGGEGVVGGAGGVADAADPLRTIRVGSKTFTEQYILAAVISQRLEQAGVPVGRVESLGSTIGFDALRQGQIDVFVDYSGTIWANYMGRDDVQPDWATHAAVAGWLAEEHGVRSLGSLGFENAYALAIRRDTAEELGIDSIEDLIEHAPSLKIGSDYEFFSRPEWTRLRATYGLNFAGEMSFDSTFMYGALVNGEVDVITAFSSDGRIAAFDLVVLEDPRGAFPPYEAMVLLSPAAAEDGRVVEPLRTLIGAIDVDRMRRANLWVDEEGVSPASAAQRLLEALEEVLEE